MVLASLVGDIVIFYLFAKRLAPNDWQDLFWRTTVLFLATPIFFAVTGLAIPDHLLTFFCLLALYCFTTFFLDFAMGTTRSYRWLYGGAVALGLALLCKFNAALLAGGIAVFIVVSPRHRGLLLDPHLYLAALVCIVIQAPVIVWNVQEHFASVHFALKPRRPDLSAAATYTALSGFAIGAAALLSPFLLIPLVRFLLGWSRDVREETIRWLARSIFAVSSVTFIVISFSSDVLFHWNIVAYLGFAPFIALYLKPRWLLAGQVVYGSIFGLIALTNYAVVPVSAIAGTPDETSSWSYGWPETAEAVEAVAAEHKDAFIAGTNYALASNLAFALKDPDVTSIEYGLDEYDYIVDAQKLAGRNAIIVDDFWRGLQPYMREYFADVELVKTIPIVRYGHTLNTHHVYLARGFKPPPWAM
jgi:4-amino-4-deoxy-L-arabinose transferase-like glycosyltransferase